MRCWTPEAVSTIGITRMFPPMVRRLFPGRHPKCVTDLTDYTPVAVVGFTFEVIAPVAVQKRAPCGWRMPYHKPAALPVSRFTKSEGGFIPLTVTGVPPLDQAVPLRQARSDAPPAQGPPRFELVRPRWTAHGGQNATV